MASLWADRKDELYHLRYEEHRTLQQIGDYYGVSRERVRQIIDRYNWPTISPGSVPIGLPARIYDRNYWYDLAWKLGGWQNKSAFCRETNINYNQLIRIAKFLDLPDISFPTGNNNAHWSGGKCISPEGYILLTTGSLDEYWKKKIRPGWHKKYKHIMEHQYIIENDILGKKIPVGWVCHHIDENRKNNNPDNLAIMPRVCHLKLHRKYKKSIISQQKFIKYGKLLRWIYIPVARSI